MADIFDNVILCNKCGKKMKKLVVERSGFKIRALECQQCGGRTYHPSDIEEFNKYSQLQKQNFQVKLRRVGNSYTVSIPKELIDFFEEAETADPFEGIHKKMNDDMNQMVTLALKHANQLSLSFGKEGNYDRTQEFNKGGAHAVVREKSETKPLNFPGGKGFVSRKVKVIRMSNQNNNQTNNQNLRAKEPRLFEEEEEEN